MPDDTQGEMPAEQQATGSETQADATQQTTADIDGAFDPERAMETIKKQREAERAALAKAEKLQKELEKYQDAERKRKEAEMSETDKLKAALAEREEKLKVLEYAQLQRTAADKHGLPADLATRLKGETLEELDADAAALAKLLPKQATQKIANPGNNATGKGETEDQQRARVYGWNTGIFDPAEIEKRGGGVHWVDKNE